VTAKLDALLRIRYAGVDADAARTGLAARYLANEVRRYRPQIKPRATLEEVIVAAATLTTAELAVVRRRSLFYGCDDLIGLLVRKRVKGDAIAREEAVLYVQDRLQRDDFRRIEAFEQSRGASFVTYMWQVINNLLLDYLRAHGKKTQRESSDANAVIESQSVEWEAGTPDEMGRTQTHAEGQAEAAQLRALLADAMAAGAPQDGHPLRAQLREHLHLSSQERILLKAMFQYDMTVGEISELPGFEMTPAETYRLYYRAMDRLMDAFKHAGLAETLRSLVSNAAPRVTVSVAGEDREVAATRIRCFMQEGRTTACYLHWRGRMEGGSMAEAFTKTCKRLIAFFTLIDASTALADNVLAATCNEWRDTGEVRIDGVARIFRINTRILSGLKSRFCGERAEIKAAVARINDIETGEMPR